MQMTFTPRTLPALLLLACSWVHAEEGTRFRQWIAGQEAGGSSHRLVQVADGLLDESHEWTRLERMGSVIEQDLLERAVKTPDGAIRFTWTLAISAEPLEGGGSWSPREPGILRMTFKNGPPRTLELPADATIWPGDADDRLKAAARDRVPVRIKLYSLPTQQWNQLELTPVGPEPLPGFPDTVHFKGKAAEGGLAEQVEYWVSPSQGEIRQLSSLSGIALLEQRFELPPPIGGDPVAGLFERTIKTLARHPFLLWLPEVQVRWTGKGTQELPEDGQQQRIGNNRYRLSRAPAPGPEPARELPVRGRPAPEDAPFLAPTPLAQFRDPVFDGLDRRLAAPAGASRWELAQRVTHFVYDWIRDKDYTVGFASAQEVARTPKGDCTEHGCLAIALLRRLGVPARGVTGWVAIGDTMGLHFWVEARIGQRWIPLDPTFDQAPASAYRLKLGTTDLADLGSVGWETAALSFLEGSWSPEGLWAQDVRVQGDTATVPDGVRLRLPSARWRYQDGALTLLWEGSHPVQGVPRPAPAQTAPARRLQGALSHRSGWWSPDGGQLWLDLGRGHWLQVDRIQEPQAYHLLDALEAN
jgi:transglutaminase-like putative cysteine protease